MSLKQLIKASVLLVVLIVLAQISIPLPSGVPFTFQTLAVGLVGSLLNVRLAGLVVVVYLLMGAIGLPVFAGGASGVVVFTSSSGGYLWGFLLQAVMIASLWQLFTTISVWRAFWINSAAAVVQLLIGCVWLVVAMKMSVSTAVVVGLIPYLLSAVIKAGIVAIIAVRLRKLLKSSMA